VAVGKAGRWTPRAWALLGWWRARDALVRDADLAALFTLLAFVPTLSAVGARIGDLSGHQAGWVCDVLAVAQTLPLALRSRWPALCLSVVGTAFAVSQALGCPATFASLGLYLALYSAGAHQRRARGATAAAAAAGYLLLALVLRHRGSPDRVGDYLAFSLGLAVFGLAGGIMRRRRVAEAERRRLAAEAATAAERARIARELHDVVTHHVTAMVVQTDAAQYMLTSAPDRAGESLTAVSATGRRALTELRHLLDVLEATGDSAAASAADRTPTLGKLGDLVEQARRSGQPVDFAEEDEREGTPEGERPGYRVDAELAAYRVVQEALTNAMKYAPGGPTAVRVRHGAERLEIEVVSERRDEPGTPTPAPPPPPAGSGGRGLRGLRARLRMLDGELSAGPRPEGGFAVRAVIPTGSGERRDARDTQDDERQEQV